MKTTLVFLGFVTLAACGSKQPAAPDAVTISALCSAIVEATCDRAIRCGTVPDDRAACRAQAADAFDECPLMVQAVDLAEADYSPEAAADYVQAVREAGCADPQPDPIALQVFTPKQPAGAACHSKVSCQGTLTCDGHSTSTPAGTCN